MAALTVELHCHTCYSKDSLLRPGELLRAARLKGLDRVAITDHNTIQGALQAAKLEPDRVIVGEEIMTTQGELLAFFLSEGIPAGLEPEEAIGRLRDQGAVISVSHPFDPHRAGAWKPTDLETIRSDIDALEVYNARCFTTEPNRQAAAWAKKAGLLGTAGSDAHAASELGRAVMLMPAFQGAKEFKAALAHSEVQGRLSSPFVHLYSRWALWRKAMGWEM
ncbi:MAG: PHP domain-containing protein [Anaerolineales bacterium]